MNPRRWGVLGVLLILLLVARYLEQGPAGPGAAPERETTAGESAGEGAAGGEAAILDAFERRASNIWVEAAGAVDRVLPDDNEGSRHQRFIVRLASGHTVLVSHNIDLAPRIESLSRGDTVTFRGEFEWNSQGGVVHWTHHDPSGDRAGGWIDHAGRRYR